jgi:hypothetical protein
VVLYFGAIALVLSTTLRGTSVVIRWTGDMLLWRSPRNTTHYGMAVEDNVIDELTKRLEASAITARRAALRNFNQEVRF